MQKSKVVYVERSFRPSGHMLKLFAKSAPASVNKDSDSALSFSVSSCRQLVIVELNL
jgi:hypothetical protein